MTVSTQVSRNEYTGNGATTQYDFTFRILDKSHLLVQTLDTSESIVTLTLGTDYSVSGVNRYSGGKVVLNTPLPDGYKISIERSTPVTQEASIRNQGGFFPEIHEDAFDKLTMIIQRMYGWWSGLALKKPSWLANYYDAMNNRIRNLRDPALAQDAATKSYVDSSDSDLQHQITSNFNRSLRVPDSYISQLPSAEDRAWKGLGFDGAGQPKLQDPAEMGLWGYVPASGSFEEGGTLEERFNVLFWEATQEYWRWDGAHPKVVAAGSTPSTSGGVGPGLWVDVTDATLRGNLASSAEGLGIGLVNTVYGEMADRILKRIYGFNVCAHGARSIDEDGYEDFDSRVAIQSAIDAAHAAWLATGSVQNVFVPSGSTFLVSSVPAVMESGATSGLWCLRIRSGVRLVGGGTIKPVDNAFAADTTLFRVIGSDSGGSTRPTDVHFEGITIDGNLENQVANSNAHGIWVYTLGNSSIKKCKFHDIAGCGGSLRGMIETPAKNIEVTGNLATNCGNIGLQVSWFDGLIVTANIVRDCTDNGIDIYGNSGESGEPTGINFSVNGNFVYNCLTGVFLETVANGSVTGNTLQGNAQNIHLNRINSQPRNITIDSNAIDGGLYGIRVQGDMRGINITGNTIRGYSIAAFRFGNSTTVNSSTSYINARNNTITPTVTNSYVVWIGGGTASRITVKNNTVENTIGLTAEYLYHNQATTNVQVTVGAWKFWGGSLSDTGVESYSEGTFSPTVAGGTTGGTGTYTNQYGKYTKIGNIVHFTLSVAWSAHTGAGAILINGLPFAASADNNQTINAAISSVSASTTSARLFMRNINGSTVAQMIFFDGAAATSYPQINSAGGSVQVSGFYFAS